MSGKIKSRFIRFGIGTDDVSARDIPANVGILSNLTPEQIAAEGADKLSAYIKGIDNRIGNSIAPQAIEVRPNPNPGQFSSVKAAVDSIMTASETEPWVVEVAAGIYVEDTITMKPWISVIGSDDQSTIIESSDPNETLFIGAPNSEIRLMTIRGSMTQPLVKYTNNTASTSSFSIVNCALDSCGTAIQATGGVGLTIYRIVGLRVVDGGNISRVVFIDGTGGSPGLTIVFVTGFVWQKIAAPYPAAIYEVTSGGRLIADASLVEMFGGVGDGFLAYNNAQIDIVYSAVNGMGVGIHAPNIGSPSRIATSDLILRGNTQDVLVEHPGTTGNFSGSANSSLVDIDQTVNMSVFYKDLTNGGLTVSGALRFGNRQDLVTDISDLLIRGPTLGVLSGGVLSDGAGFVVNVSEGLGYLSTGAGPDHRLVRISWSNTSIDVGANKDVYLFFNSAGVLTSDASFPATTSVVLLGRVVTNGSVVVFIDQSPLNARHSVNGFDKMARDGIGPIYNTGSIVSQASPFILDVSPGNFYLSMNEYSPVGGNGILFNPIYSNGMGGWTTLAATNTVQNTHYDDGSGTLEPISLGFFTKHVLYIAGVGSDERHFLLYGQEEFDSLAAALTGNNPAPPSFFKDSVVGIAAIVVEEGALSISQILDSRPTLAFRAGGGSAASIHGNLSGLSSDDHTQYLLVNGARPMAGNLAMGANNITGVGLINGVDVLSHASRHLPNGSDALASAAPTTSLSATTANAVGIQNSFARSDHIHAISTGVVSTQLPAQANAAGVSANLARADHVHNIPVDSAIGLDANSTSIEGAAASFARSNHAHAISTGVVSSQTPNLANAAGISANLARADHIHNIPTAVAIGLSGDTTNTQGIAASFSQSDHTHAIATGSASTISAATANSAGVSANLARADHTHDILTGVVSTQTPDQVNAEGVSANLARADHVHNIPAESAVGLDAASVSTEGIAASFARSNHTHAIASGVVSTQLPAQANDAGISPNFARADHIHNIPVATANTLNATQANAEGDAASFARSNHIHAISTGVVSTQTPDQTNAAGTSANLARADHIHNIPADAPTTSLSATTANAEGIAASFGRSDHTHAILTGVVSTQTPDQANAQGSSANLARADHIHNIPSAAPTTTLDPTTTNAQGVAATFALSDHSHAIATGLVANITTINAGDVAGAGIVNAYARVDHEHAVATATAVGLTATSTNTEGVSTSLARADHTHTIASAAASTQTPDQANATGSSTSFARADHTHNIATAAAVNIGTANAQGASTSFSRADHVHQGVHGLRVNTGTYRFGDISLVEGVGVDIVDDGAGNFTIAAATSLVNNELHVTYSGSGLTVDFSEGSVRHNNIFSSVGSGSLLLSANESGEIYVDSSGTVVATTGSAQTPDNLVPLASYTTNATDVTDLGDLRVRVNQALVWGQNSDVVIIQPDATASAGTSERYARADHRHAIDAATAVSLNATAANAEGVSTSFARADHIHAINTGAASTQTPDQSNAQGSSSDLARADHVHNIPTAAPSSNLSATTANAQGISTSFSRADHSHAITTGAASTQTPDQVNAEGTSPDLARADHIHNIPAEAPTTSLSATTTNAEGVAASFGRSDHSHAILTGVVSTQTPDQANAQGSSANLARADHIHNIPTAAPTTTLDPTTANAQGAAGTFALSDHSHAIATGLVANITTINAGDVAGAGTVDAYARVDHEHAVATAVATGLDTTSTNTEGSSTSLARADHTHAIASAAAATQTPDQVNAVGVSTSFARADHIHNIPTAAPTTTLSPATSNAVGVANSFSRSDHTHAIATGVVANISTITPDAAANAGVLNSFSRSDHVHAIVAAIAVSLVPDAGNSEGVSNSFARADHVHNIPTANVATIGVANAQGVSLSFSRSDHVHAHGDQTVGTLHAIVTQVVNGFMSAADKVKLDQLNTGILQYSNSLLQTTNLTTFIPVDLDVNNYSYPNGLVTKTSITDFRADFNGAVEVSYKVLGFNSNDNRSFFAAVFLNGVLQPFTETGINTLSITARMGSCSGVFIINVADGDIITLHWRAGSNSATIVAEGASMSVKVARINL